MTEESASEPFDAKTFRSKLRGHLDKAYPTARKYVNNVQTAGQRVDERKVVDKKLPTKVLKSAQELQEEAAKVDALMKAAPAMPEKEGEVYHVVAMDWWTQWKAYAGVDAPVTEAKEHPGPINTAKQLESLCEQEAWLKHNEKDNV